MEFGICHLNSVALRKDPSDQSEMLSQLLFGDIFEIMKNEGEWIHIHLSFDHYEGWVLKNQIDFLSEENYKELSEGSTFFSDEMVTLINTSKNELQVLSLGASLPLYKDQQFIMNTVETEFDGDILHGMKPKSNLVKTAYKYLNTPFLWGGKTPFGIDCSGFTQMVYKINGYSLLRDAHQQASQGEVLSFIEESEPGDLAFFDNEEGEIIHCGILLDNNYIIHCHGKVRIDRIDQSGIYNVDTKRHTHKLRVMKQLF